jgi:hypothetical protein
MVRHFIFAFCRHHCSTPPHGLPNSGNRDASSSRPGEKKGAPSPRSPTTPSKRRGSSLEPSSPPPFGTPNPFPLRLLTLLSTTNASVRSKDPCNPVPAYYDDLLAFIFRQGVRSILVMKGTTTSRSTSSCRSTPHIPSLYLISVRAPHFQGLDWNSSRTTPLPACTSSAEGQVGFTVSAAGETAGRTQHSLPLVTI